MWADPLSAARADAQTVLSDPCLGLNPNYPFPMMFATIAVLLIFLMEFLIKKVIRQRALRVATAAAEQRAADKEVEQPASHHAQSSPLLSACP